MSSNYKIKSRKIITFRINEYSLYKFMKNLKVLIKIISLLADVQDQSKLEIIFETFKVDTVYHAVAYKHVPLVEENICGLKIMYLVFCSKSLCIKSFKSSIYFK